MWGILLPWYQIETPTSFILSSKSHRPSGVNEIAHS